MFLYILLQFKKKRKITKNKENKSNKSNKKKILIAGKKKSFFFLY